MVHKCNDYETQESYGLHMVVAKDTTIIAVITDAQHMISKCLDCPHIKEGCESTANFVRYLDKNLDSK